MDTLSDDLDVEKITRKPGIKENGLLTPQVLNFLDNAVAIENEEAKELSFTTDFMTQTSLPISEPTGSYYMRSNGRFKLVITPTIIDIDGIMTACYPYGVYPRRALIWIISEALKNDSPKIDIGATLNEFMGKIGLRAGGGQRAKDMRRQLLALLGSPIRTTYTNTKDGRTHDVVSSFLIATNTEIWTDEEPRPIGQRPLVQSTIELSAEFFAKLKKNGAVPLDSRAIDALGNDALALDIYAWVTWRVHAARGKIVDIKWETLQKQFGSEIKETRFFKRKFLKALGKVERVHPGLKYDSTPGSFILKPSLAAVGPRRTAKKTTR